MRKESNGIRMPEELVYDSGGSGSLINAFMSATVMNPANMILLIFSHRKKIKD